jgi:N-acetylmuramoyl-L-alanine amidase
MGHQRPTAISYRRSVAPRWGWRFATPVLLAILAVAGPLGAQSGARPAPSKLPPVPPRTGPLAISVVYPAPTDVVEAGDSSFVFGQVGDGRARLTVNGQRVTVAPNGAFLGWIQIPVDTLVTLSLEAVRGSDTARLAWPVRRTVRFVPPQSGPWLDTLSVQPRGRVWWPKDEPLPIRLRAAPGATVEIVMPTGERVPLSSDYRLADLAWGTRAFETDTTKLRRAPSVDRYAGEVLGAAFGPPSPMLPVPVPDTAGMAPADIAYVLRLGHGPLPKRPRIEVILGADTLRWEWIAFVTPLSGNGQVVLLDDDRARKGGTDSIAIGKTIPSGTYYYFFPTGTRAVATARVGGDLRLRLSDESTAWVAAADAIPVPGNLPSRGAVVSSIRVTRSADRVAIRVPVSWRVPFKVLEEEKRLTVQFFGAQGDVNWIQYGPADPMVSDVRWSQSSGDVVALTVDLAQSVWGYRARWEGNDLILEVKRPPRINAERPLAGLRIVVDAGHPPAGATGPTGFREGEANLGVAKQLERMLRAAGATVLMPRKDSTPIELWPRIRFADSVNADLLVSVHNNALPDGVNPFTNSGTSVYYNQPRSLAWARPVEAALVRRLGLRELGVGRGDLALVRPTWMPSILTEGMFMMIPEQEAALRSLAGQRLYAQAVYEGTLAFLRERARAQAATSARP